MLSVRAARTLAKCGVSCTGRCFRPLAVSASGQSSRVSADKGVALTTATESVLATRQPEQVSWLIPANKGAGASQAYRMAGVVPAISCILKASSVGLLFGKKKWLLVLSPRVGLQRLTMSLVLAF